MLDNPMKPAEWLSPKAWNEICTMDGMPSFAGIREAVVGIGRMESDLRLHRAAPMQITRNVCNGWGFGAAVHPAGNPPG